MTDLYVVTRGFDGPVIAGPYLGYDVACRARDAMPGWRRLWFRPGFWVRPVEAPGLRPVDLEGDR